jgi:bifunctional DNA-binding transcriptional regulator/antitoxin component of YhaV-PrlF toxin-antitoxin module
MVLVEKKGAGSFVIPDEQAEALGLSKGKKYEISKATDGVFVLTELDNSIFDLLAEKKLADRVEGKFEEFLSSDERARLAELIKEGRVIPFRLSDQYRKAVYKTKEEVEQARPEPFEPERVKTAVGTAAPSKPVLPERPVIQEKPAVQPKPAPEWREPAKSPVKQPSTEMQIEKEEEAESDRAPISPMFLPSMKGTQPQRAPQAPQEAKPAYTLERDSFTVLATEAEAKQLCNERNDEIRRRELFGIKSFGGEYFVIKAAMYERLAPMVLGMMRKKSRATAEEISIELKLNRQLVIVICEFLKEEGEITERRKELFEFVS